MIEIITDKWENKLTKEFLHFILNCEIDYRNEYIIDLKTNNSFYFGTDGEDVESEIITAITNLMDLINCKNCHNCEECFNCIDCNNCFNCEDCNNCDWCYDCKNKTNVKNEPN